MNEKLQIFYKQSLYSAHNFKHDRNIFWSFNIMNLNGLQNNQLYLKNVWFVSRIAKTFLIFYCQN